MDIRQNDSYVVQFKAKDDSSGIDYVILPNGERITDTTFDYTFKTNGSTIVGVMDKAGNFLEYMVPISNINKEPEVLITPSTTNWTNSNVTVDIKASNSVNYKGNFQLTNIGAFYGPVFPNYTSYVGKTFKVTGKVKLLSYKDIGKDFILSIGYLFKGRALSEHTYKLKGNWIRSTNLVLADFNNNNGEVPIEFEFIVPGEYSEGLQAWGRTNLDTVIGEAVKFEFKDLEYTLVDDNDFKITGIKLPNGNLLDGATSYKDTISTEGIINNTYVVMDNRGKESSRTIRTKIDKTKPTGSITATTTLPTNKDVVLTINGAYKLSGIKEIVTPDGVVIVGNKLSVSTNYIASVNGKFVFKIIDLAGNEHTLNANIGNIDKSKPSVTVNGTSDIWKRTDVLVSATATDNNSDIDRVEYRLSGATNKPWSIYSNGLIIDSEGVTNVEFRAVDNAGNISDIVRGNVRLDKTPTTANISTSANSNTRDILISAKNIYDIHSGASKILVSNFSDYTNASEVILENHNNKNFNFKLDKKDTQTDHYGERRVYIKIFDYAGNESDYIVSTILNPSVQYKVSIDSPVNNSLYRRKESIISKWSLHASDPDFPNIQQKKSIFKIYNLSTGEHKEYHQEGAKTDFAITNLPVGKYNIQVDSYISDNYKVVSEKHLIRVEKYLLDGIVNSKIIDVGSPIKFANVKTSVSVPKGTRILGKIYYKTASNDFNKDNYVDLNDKVGLKDDIFINLPVKASAIKIEYSLYNDNKANEELTPYLDSVVVLAR